MEKDQVEIIRHEPDGEWAKFIQIRNNILQIISDPEKLRLNRPIVCHLKRITALKEKQLYDKVTKNCLVCESEYSVIRAVDIGRCKDCIDHSGFYHEAGHAFYALRSGIDVDYVSCSSGYLLVSINEEDIVRKIENNNYQGLLNTYLAGLVTQSVVLRASGWLEDDILLEKNLTKFVEEYFLKRVFFNYIYGSFSNIIYYILLSATKDIYVYLIYVILQKPKFKLAFLNSKLDMELVHKLKFHIKEVKNEILKPENWKIVCTISNELFDKQHIDKNQIKNLVRNTNKTE